MSHFPVQFLKLTKCFFFVFQPEWSQSNCHKSLNARKPKRCIKKWPRLTKRNLNVDFKNKKERKERKHERSYHHSDGRPHHRKSLDPNIRFRPASQACSTCPQCRPGVSVMRLLLGHHLSARSFSQFFCFININLKFWQLDLYQLDISWGFISHIIIIIIIIYFIIIVNQGKTVWGENGCYLNEVQGAES